jgi:hypothetical protein
MILVYYLKLKNNALKKLELCDDILKVSNKDSKGFTASEMKFFKYILKKRYQFTLDDIKFIKKQIDIANTN